MRKIRKVVYAVFTMLVIMGALNLHAVHAETITKNVTNKITNAQRKIVIKGYKERFVANGKNRKQNLKIYYKKKKLKQNRDYTLKYKDNKKAGIASVTVNFTGKYKNLTPTRLRYLIELGTPEISSITTTENSATVTWKKQKGASDKITYIVRLMDTTTGTQTAVGVIGSKSIPGNQNKCVFTGLDSGTKYSVRVSSFLKNNNSKIREKKIASKSVTFKTK